jgi:photosystem II stability/assembly factor-like uncharacterized protein
MFFKRALIMAARLAALAVACWASPIQKNAAVPIAGPVTVVQTDAHHQGTLLAGTSTALLFRSRDGADSWTRLPFPAELRSNLHAILIDPVRSNVYFVAVTSETPEYAGLFRSVDEGANWEQVNDLYQKQVWALASWKQDGNVMAAGTQEGVYLTRDGGENWIPISSPGPSGPHPVVSLAFDPLHRNVLYAGTPHLAWKTIDSGATWHPIRNGMQEDSDIFSIEADRNRPRQLFAGACSGIYRSLDGGNTWSSLERAVGAQFRTYIVAHAPRRANVLFAGTNAGLLQSSDGGATWRQLSSVPTRSIAFDPFALHRIFVATDQGVLRSQDGGRHFMEATQVLHGKQSAALVERRAPGSVNSSANMNTRTKQ